MGERVQADKKLVADALLRTALSQDAAVMDELQEVLRRVKSKKPRKLLKIALSRNLSLHGFEALKVFIACIANAARGTVEWLTKFKTAERFLVSALFYNKKNPEALSSLGLLYLKALRNGDGFRTLSAALKIPRQYWHDLTYRYAISETMDMHKETAAGWWEEVATSTSPAPRCYHASCRDAGCMYVYGGLGKGCERDMPVLDDIWVLDMQSSPMVWTQIELQPCESQDKIPAMRSAAMCVCASTLYIHGGEGEGSGTELFAEDLHTKVSKRVRVEQQSNTPGQRLGHAMFERRGSLYLWGGHATDALIWQLDTSADTLEWVQKEHDAESPPPMHGAHAHVL